MSKRLQVLMDSKEYNAFSKMAKANGMSLGEWVRQSLRKAARSTVIRNSTDRIRKLKLIAASSNAPTGDIEQMLSEIESGRNLKP